MFLLSLFSHEDRTINKMPGQHKRMRFIFYDVDTFSMNRNTIILRFCLIIKNYVIEK